MSEETPPAAAPQPPPEVGEVSYPTLDELAALLPQYEMQEIVGVGGMGAVYKARQTTLDRWVAIKVLPESAAQNDEDAHRFIKEARAMARLVHPHIVAVFDFGQTHAGHLYLVMEFVEGCDLHRRTRAGEITPQKAREVIAQLCDALQFAHDHGVAHRDIKPANILITDQWKVKVADFGLARELAAQPNSDEPEYGTPDYTAPERLVIGAVVDHRADIYSLGVVIHEMLTGRTPMAAGPDAGKGLPEGFAGVISKCLMQDPARRYQRAADVKVALLTATAENRRQTPAATSAPAPAPTHGAEDTEEEDEEQHSRQQPLLTGLAPIGWGLAVVVLLSLFGWLILRNKTQKWDHAAAPPPPTAGAAGMGDLAVFAPPQPAPVKPPEPPPDQPAPAPPTEPPPTGMTAGLGGIAPVPSPGSAASVAAPLVPLDQPFLLPDGPPGEIARFRGHTGAVGSLHVLPDQRRLLSVSSDGTLRVWDLMDQKELLHTDPGIGPIGRADVDRSAQRALVAGQTSNMLAMVDLRTGQVQAVTGLPDGQVVRAIFTPNGNEAVVAANDGEANLLRWQPDAAETLTAVKGWPHRIYDIAALPDGSGVVVAGGRPDANNPKFVEYTAGKVTFGTEQSNQIIPSAACTYLRVSPDQSKVVTVHPYWMDVLGWPELKRLNRIEPGATELARPQRAVLAEEGRVIVSLWSDNSLRFIEAKTAKEVHRIQSDGNVSDFALSADERWLVYGTQKTDAGPSAAAYDLVLWRLPARAAVLSPQQLASIAKQHMADLATQDPELATLRDELQATLKSPAGEEIAAELQTLNGQYIAALKRSAMSMAPREQAQLLAEVDLVNGLGLPPVERDVLVPEFLRRLRGIYRQQLATLKGKQDQTREKALQTAELRLGSLREARLAREDALGAARVDALLALLRNPDSTTATGATRAAAPASSSGTSPAAAVSRPNRAGTVFSISRSQVTGGPPPNIPAAAQVPGDLGPVVALAGGPDFVVALRQDGSLRAWGSWSGQIVPEPEEAVDVVAVDTSATAAMALRADGQVVVWGPGKKPKLWAPPAASAPASLCAGFDGSGYVVCVDGSVHATAESMPVPPANVGPVTRVFYLPPGGYCAVRPDGIPAAWGDSQPPITPLSGSLRDITLFAFGQRFALAMQKDGTLLGWGQLAPNERYRIRRFTGSLDIPPDFADRVFPVHRSDHAWELIPNPNVPAYLAEDRASVLESRLRGCIDAVFTMYSVVALKPD